MCDALVWSFDAITDINWLELIKTLAPVATAVIAFSALRNWQRQDKAKREAEFLDALIEATHSYIAEMPKPIALLEMSKIGMASHVQSWGSGDHSDKAINGAIAYIKKYGDQDAKRLLDALEAVRPSGTKLRSLAAKGQVFKFRSYADCQNAVKVLTWQVDRLEAFAGVLGSSTWNWENAEVREHLKNVMAIDPNEIRESVRDNNVTTIAFARDTYNRIYG
ncbi:hypothetical protein D9X30_0417 [Cupriavidus sp. U2]|uniref:hypothetical protein n=1 Tax=Cupriavidus sp. U2 TaxID=2920269 RepID=UPI00129DD5E1|nr:hypothetical protein [Cupriavidus sp. U2]KAI3594185.1 hypothetical protein D9X30_0417 [Cupriavidus sp. U2]